MIKQNFVKVLCVNIKLELGNPIKNAEEIIKASNESIASITVFPELAISGYSCGDLFFQSTLQEEVNNAIEEIRINNKNKGLVIFGAPLTLEGSIFNCAVVLKEDKILGVVPKHFLPNYREFYEMRYFKSGKNTNATSIYLNGEFIPFGNLVFSDPKNDLHLGIEICEDMWGAITPASYLSVNGANVIVNLSASNETLGKSDIRKICVLDNSRRNVGAYIYASSSIFESTSETVFAGHNIVAVCGDEILNKESFDIETSYSYADIDLGKINFHRKISTNLHALVSSNYIVSKILFSLDNTDYKFHNKIDIEPFVPKNEYNDFYKLKNLLETALYRRLSHTHSQSLIIGVSGGLDSTLALLIAVNAFKKLNKPLKDIIAVTMPGLGTSERTKSNAFGLMEKLGVTLIEKSIVQSSLDHFDLIEHDSSKVDITYENTQARIRTLILMNLANKHNGIVLGTGDMSELALGWCTYNGDQMSMYGINAGLAKTTVRFMVRCYAKYEFTSVSDILDDVINTPISPELTSQSQSTEDSVGKYEINDFILYRYLACGDNEERISYLLEVGFKLSKEEASSYANKFFKRFFSQQFKRQALPDGPKVLEVSLSPRGDYRMPSDIKR